MEDYERFLQLHRAQLQRVPEHLWRGVHTKLLAEVTKIFCGGGGLVNIVGGFANPLML